MTVRLWLGCKMRWCDKIKIEIKPGTKFGRLTVISEGGKSERTGRRLLLCKCECGNKKKIGFKELRNGSIRSCGCLRVESAIVTGKKKRIWESSKEMQNSPITKESTHYYQIPISDNPCVINGNINVSCKMCGKVFPPTRMQVYQRIRAINGKTNGECNFYCSDLCKNTCILYHHKSTSIDPRIAPQKSEKQKARSCQSKALKQLQCDEMGYTYCEKCGELMPDLHHTLEIAKYGERAINSSTHILLCYKCHLEMHNHCK